MDASSFAPPVATTITVGQHWTFHGPGSLKLVVSSLHTQTSSTDANVPFESLVGFQMELQPASPGHIDSIV